MKKVVIFLILSATYASSAIADKGKLSENDAGWSCLWIEKRNPSLVFWCDNRESSSDTLNCYNLPNDAKDSASAFDLVRNQEPVDVVSRVTVSEIFKPN